MGAINFAKEFSDSFRKMASDAIKEERQRARIAANEKRAAELKRLRHVLMVNRVFRCLALPSVKRDLLAGANGAPLVSEPEMAALTELAASVRLSGDDDDDVDVVGDDFSSTSSWDAAAECLQALLDGGSKKTQSGLGYGAVKSVLDNIVESGYCEKVKVTAVVDASTITTPPPPTANDESDEASESVSSSSQREDNNLKGEFNKESSEEG